MLIYTQIIDFRLFISYYLIWRRAFRVYGVAGRGMRAQISNIAH